MPTKKHKIEVLKVEQIEGTSSFEDVIMEISDIYQKMGELHRINATDKGDFILGSVGRIKTIGIPPKGNQVTGEQSRLDINEDEGLAYSNVFLYVKSLKILFYEFNMNGCYIGAFSRIISEQYFATSLNTVAFNFAILLSPKAYNRALKIEKYKALHLKIANPKALITNYMDEHDNMGSSMKIPAELNADILEMTYKMRGMKFEGMPTENIYKILNWVNGILSKKEINKEGSIEKCQLVGYYQDPEDEKMKRTDIDLIFDKYFKYIRVDEPYVFKDTQIREKSQLLEELYYTCKGELEAVI